MPNEQRAIDPKAWEALEEAVSASNAIRAAENLRMIEYARRAKAIKEAQRLGLTLAVIAKRLGVSNERVRTMKIQSKGRSVD